MNESKFKDLKCPECDAPMELVFTNYRYRNGKQRPRYQCIHYPDCSGAHGSHPDGTPLGVPGDSKTRMLRQSLHEIFEIKYPGPIERVRKKTALWLSGNGFPDHIGEMSAIECRTAIHIIINKKTQSHDDENQMSAL